MIVTEITERKAIQVPAVGGIAKGAEIGVVGRNDDDAAARCKQAMKLLHRADHVGYVFDDVGGADLAEGAVAEWEWETIQVCDDVGPGVRVEIQAYCTGILIEPAAHIENRKLAYKTGTGRGRLSFGGYRS